ncbi:hypothetical protein NEK97_00450 [Paenarthrobacter sp. UW852]|uniref:hypothetical protein n=1 Tax=Paenarthrobacter sp. UW852 TaxID=2951989 RepID=UPI002147EC0C|nr:hypothetical protein [Paenarthrobacter sp. UW852]MCR1159924.1 hypothetical protein [Paenarthrobacter sp. UW852]
MSLRTAQRRRLRLVIWSALPVLLVLAVAAKLLSVGLLGSAAGELFRNGQHDELARAASWLGVANMVEPYKAPFASGDAHVLAGEFAAARTDFEAALHAGTGDDECKVRVNLVLSIEKLGDAAADRGTAARLFKEALDAANAAPEKCREAGSANADGEGSTLDSAASRLAGKIQGTDGKAGDAPTAPDKATEPQAGKLKDLRDSAQQAQKERSEGQQRDEYLRGPDNGSGVDRPW